MKKILLGLVSTALSAVLLAGCAAVGVGVGSASSSAAVTPSGEIQKIKVYTSFYTMYDFAQKIGGDKIEVVNLVPSGTEPHDWEPQANDIVGLEKADVFIYNGAGLEHWASSVLSTLQNKDLITVEASSGIPLLEGKHESEEKEADAEGASTDPHVWLSPVNAKKEMETIKNALVKADPSNKETFEANYSKYAAKADELDNQFRQMTNGLKNKDLIVAHQAFGYLCKEYSLNQVAIEGLSPDSEPDAARMAEIIQFAKERNITTIFFEELVSPKVAETIAKATGAKTAVLDPVEGLSDENKAKGMEYFSIMEKNLEAIRVANGG